MTREEGFDLYQWIEEKGIRYTPCVCGSAELDVSDRFYGAVAISAHGDAGRGEEIETMPMAAIVCTSCGRVQFLDLHVMGIA